MNSNKIISIIKYISYALIDKRYNEIIENAFKQVLSAEEIALSIQEFGGKITQPPANAFENVDIYIVKENAEANVEFDLWFDDKKSDLTLSCNIIEQDGIYKYAIEAVHVL